MPGFKIFVFRNKYFYLCAVILHGIFTSGCATMPEIVPDWTTYPYEPRSTTTSILTGFHSRSYTSSTVKGEGKYVSEKKKKHTWKKSFKGETKGYSGIREAYITPHTGESSSETSLIKRIPETGRNLCRDDYYIYNTKYYYGSEATLSFLGIGTPALKVELRCKIKSKSGNSTAKKIDKYSGKFEDSGYFDIVVKEFPANPEILLDSLEEYFGKTNQELKIYKLKPDVTVFETGNVEDGKQRSLDELYEFSVFSRILLLIEPGTTGSSVALRYYDYRVATHSRGVYAAGTQRKGYLIGLVPSDRRFLYRKSLQILEDIEKIASL